ncbi:hypothetical protein [Okeania sp. KiyG1]|uniref:hypothetical protein n=1 Tax=Okeania sp. KiyG1 TaxID=2720165 RepID=UPI001921B676|nr:hypothetical protein [Okeania sp. KiyG1]GGA27697.1 hypothetical protein CYANOKiyG1_43900 [Okeania sp. KiyG1]
MRHPKENIRHPFENDQETLESLQKSQVEANPNTGNDPSQLIATTQALGEEGGAITTAFDDSENGDEPIPTTQAIGEEGGFSEPIPTTQALGEEGGFSEPIPTTQALGEEGGIDPIGVLPGEPTTRAVGEEGGAAPIGVPPREPTTRAVGEEGGADPINNEIITQVGSEEGTVTTLAIGEEGRDFNEEIYRQSYPGIDVAINRGVFSSGLEHYIQFGQFEIERIGFFTDNDSNDIINAFGNNTRIIGVSVIGYDIISDRIIPGSLGTGEIDILVGSSGIEGVDQFILGSSPESPFYLGFGYSDFALIQNFDAPLDRIQLSGSLNDYSFEIVNNSVNISTVSGDLIAIVEDVSSLDNLNLDFI